MRQTEIKNKQEAQRESRRKAQKKWRSKNRVRSNYLVYRSTARSFVLKHATLEDLEELQAKIEEVLNK
ncbi:unknown [Streptococcus phage M102AD]|uniref:hypothetical protein n=1 Tax=Streptococcus phage M102AD TaxID=1587907 RepID=UPI00022FA237|nr:hypothetical protein AVU37_gp23 [Streptococcus phage M102AD]ABD48926.1 unknown [Streptococcus phage M102AD]